MFFYLSFLRTPPYSSLQSSSVVFTPQVSNDLRTEPFSSSVDIFYWWISDTPQNVAGTRLSEPAKLTTWRQENAYKPLQVPPPSRNVIGAAGIDCRLVLSTVPNVASSTIDLRDAEIGSVPLPVCSLPIRISPRRDGAVASAKTAPPAKQEAIARTFRLFEGDTTGGSLMLIKETVSFDLDKVNRSLTAGSLSPSFFFVFLGMREPLPCGGRSGLLIMGNHRNCGIAESA